MQTKRLGYVVALGLWLVLALLGLPQTTRAAPDDMFAKPDGSGTAYTQANPCALQTYLLNNPGRLGSLGIRVVELKLTTDFTD